MYFKDMNRRTESNIFNKDCWWNIIAENSCFLSNCEFDAIACSSVYMNDFKLVSLSETILFGLILHSLKKVVFEIFFTVHSHIFHKTILRLPPPYCEL